MEHLNWLAKDSMKGLGSNISGAAVQRIGKALGQTTKVLKNFDCDNNLKEESGCHSKRSYEKYLEKLLYQNTHYL